MTLYEFIEAAITAMGGIVIPIEYAICSVLIPDRYKEVFQGKSEMLLAFDYEVAKENPESEFVTYGSYIFDTILQIARTSPKATQRYAYAEKLTLQNAAEKVKRHIDFHSGSLEITSQRGVVGLWALYRFAVQFIADERSEEMQEVWVNLIDGSIDTQMSSNVIFYDERETAGTLPYLPPVDMRAAYATAYEDVKNAATSRDVVLTNETQVQTELARIEKYYDEMIAENRKRATRKGVTDERINEIAQKENALEIEKNKQMNEIAEKYALKITVSLENAIVYHIPLVELHCKINSRRDVSEQLFYYDPIFKRILTGETLP